MKIGFIGLRGFTKDSNLIDLNGITLLTGKNSSGKSSFLKLFRLLFSSFSKIKTLDDLFDIEVDIASDEFGGKEKISSIIIEKNPKIILGPETIEFFGSNCEIHVTLEINDYSIKVKQVEFYDEKGLIKKEPIGVWLHKRIKFNLYELRRLYLENMPIYNLCEEYRYVLDERSSKKTKEEFFKKYEKELLDEIATNHIAPYEEGAFLWDVPSEIGDSSIENIPFRIKAKFDGYETEMITFVEDIPPFQLSRNEFNEIFKNSNFSEDLFYYFRKEKRHDSKFNEFKFVKSIYDYILKNYFIATASYKWNELYGGFPLAHELNENDKYYDFFNNVENSYKFIFGELVHSFSNYFDPLTLVTSNILQNTLVAQIRQFGDFQSLSNIRYQPTRSFNIYNQSNVFSSFIKNWKIIDDKIRKRRITFLKKYLIEFEIADDLQIILQDNIGFIHLIKNKQTFAIIDEGSGISNVLSVALKLSEALEISYGSTYKIFNENEKFIILEEPESNLHPSLQSKLANLIVDIHNLTNVNLIIETHSEYLIRKLQYLVATKKVDQSKISINYFSMEQIKKQQYIQTKLIKIDSNGTLTDEFGPGFYDEANNLSIDLFVLNNTQNN